LTYVSGAANEFRFGEDISPVAVGINLAAILAQPTAYLHLGAGEGGANFYTAPLKFSPGANLTNPEQGAVEFTGDHLTVTSALTLGTTTTTKRNRIDRQDGWHYSSLPISLTIDGSAYSLLWLSNTSGPNTDTAYWVQGRPIRHGANTSSLLYGIIRWVGTDTRDGTAQANADPTYIILDAGASAVNGTYVNHVVSIVSGTNAGESRRIVGYTGATQMAQAESNWTIAPTADSVFRIHQTMMVAGPPVASIAVLQYGDFSKIVTEEIVVNGAYGDGVEPDLLITDLNYKAVWRNGPAKLVHVDCYNKTNAGTTNPYVNVDVGLVEGATLVLTNNATNGLEVTDAYPLTESTDTVDSSHYSFGWGSPYRIHLSVAGTGTQASDLTMHLTWVLGDEYEA
jgi:hypothetical protein